MRFSIALVSSLSVSLAYGHALITVVQGANGVSAAGFGVDANTPRDGSTPNPFEQDTSVLRQATGCGKTKLGGVVNIQNEFAKALGSGNGQLPSVAADGSVTMTVHQVNQDGAGPFKCMVDPSGTGNNFVAMQVTTNVPGRNIPIIGSLSGAKATDFPLVATMPAGMTCSGGSGNACLIRCQNSAIAGPFGSCGAVQQGGATANTSATSGSTVNANGNAKRTRRARLH